MSPVLFFLILLLSGGALVFLGAKMSGKEQALLCVIGIILILLGGYGTLTALI